MMRTALAACLLLPLAAPALAACPAPPRGGALPPAARPAPLDNPLWHEFVGGVDQALAAADRGRVQLALLGDSLTAGWDAAALARHLGRWRTLNLGVPGDHTHTMLWRLDRQWAGLRPRVAVLLIGTNNAGTTPPADTALGVAQVIRLVQARSPDTKVLLLGLLPRGDGPGDAQRRANAEVDRLVAPCADGRRVVFLDAGAALAGADGRLAPGHFTDGLHLSPAGYDALGAAIAPTVARMMR